MYIYVTDHIRKQILLLIFLMVFPALGRSGFLNRIWPNRPDEVDDVENKDDNFEDDSKPHIMPLSFISDTLLDTEDFNPEQSGLLLHEYYDALYKRFPEYKDVSDLRKKVLSFQEPLAEKLNPYYGDVSIDDFERDFGNKNAKDNPEQKLDPMFELDPAEKYEYLRPTVPPDSAIYFVSRDVETEIPGPYGDNYLNYDDDEDYDGDNFINDGAEFYDGGISKQANDDFLKKLNF